MFLRDVFDFLRVFGGIVLVILQIDIYPILAFGYILSFLCLLQIDTFPGMNLIHIIILTFKP